MVGSSSLSVVASTRPEVRAATRATYVAFAGAGFAFASWASRIPQLRDRLHLHPSELGLVLLAVAAGAVIALPLSGRVVTRVGSRRTVAATSLLLAVGLVIVAAGYQVGVLPVVVGLFVVGLANGTWDVAMNVQAAAVERHLRRSIMPRFHAGFSLGTVAGALVGAAVVALHVGVTAHLVAVAVLVTVAVPRAVRRFLADGDDKTHDDTASDSGTETMRAGAAWTERRTLMIGVFVLTFAFAEGSGNDWIALALIDGYHVSAAFATLGFAVFLAAMTTGRWIGPAFLDRHGRVRVLRALTVVAVLGLTSFIFAPWAPMALFGAAMWGAGISLGFPVGMSAASDEPSRAASRVSVVASIGYCAFLGGPPLIGFLGQHFTVLGALGAVAVLLAFAAFIADSVSPLTDSSA